MPGVRQNISVIGKIIKKNNGILGTAKKVFMTDVFKFGDLVGEDQFGNKYYQNNYYFMGKNRWVEFSESVGLNYDASQVPPEWHRWLQYISDETPSQANLPKRKWMMEHTQNLSGTNNDYMPYSTVKPKIESWVPPKK